MSTTETAPEPAEVEASEVEAHDADHDEHMHPSDWKYVQIAIILALLTAAEIATYYVDFPGETLVLLTLMVIKFALVVMWFMHLKFDSPMFTRTFVAGLGMAVVVYCAVLSTFEFWSR